MSKYNSLWEYVQNSGKQKGNGFDYLWCALYALASIAFELLVVAVEGVFGIDMNNFTITQNIVHWLVAIPSNCYMFCYQYYC